MSLDALNFTIALGAVAMQVITAALIAVYFLRRRFTDLQDIASYVKKWGLWLSLGATVAAISLSLAHSAVFGLVPCPLCYWQRIFIYPQAVLFAIALWRRDTSVALYSIILSLIGACFALYHHALQTMPGVGLPCPAEGASCAQILFLEFGYITYPMLSISLFAFLITNMLFVRERN